MVPGVLPGFFRIARPVNEAPRRIGGSNVMLSMHEAAEYVGLSYKHFAAHYREWGIVHHRIGKYVRFRTRDIESFLDSTRNRPAA